MEAPKTENPPNQRRIKNIDKIYVINMDHNTNRLHSFSELMNNLNLDFERFPAINGQLYKPKYLSPGEYGCFSSHRKIWKIIAKDNTINKAIIFEDDIIINLKLKNDYAKTKALVDHYCNNYTFDIFYLGKCLDRCDLHLAQGEGVVRTFKPSCLHAYVITKETAKILLSRYPKHPKHPVDNFLIECINKEELLAFAAQPSIFVQDNVCYESNLRSRFSQLILNTKECGVPRDASYIYAFLGLVSVIFIVVVIYWSVNRRR